MSKLAKGEKAPDFALLDQNDHEVKLSDFAGRKVLVYFYPRADTPGCTKQACAVRDARSELEGLGVAAVGISPDPPERQKKFDGKYGLSFPLLADSGCSVADAYGARRAKGLFGNTALGIVRSAFLIDESGHLQEAWYGVKPGDTVTNVATTLTRNGVDKAGPAGT